MDPQCYTNLRYIWFSFASFSFFFFFVLFVVLIHFLLMIFYFHYYFLISLRQVRFSDSWFGSDSQNLAEEGDHGKEIWGRDGLGKKKSERMLDRDKEWKGRHRERQSRYKNFHQIFYGVEVAIFNILHAETFPLNLSYIIYLVALLFLFTF